MSSDRDSNLSAARRLWNFSTPDAPHLALLTTVHPDGRPHATWMGSARTDDGDVILTITSPDSEKVVNIRKNSKVEWLITSPDRTELLYLEGDAVVVEDVAEIKRCWQAMPGKEKAFFLPYYNSGIGFAIIRTTVTSVVYVVPQDNLKARFAIGDLNQ